MSKFFGLDSPFFKVMTKIADFIILNTLVLISSIPIITIGPAFTAMYYVALKEVRNEEGYLWRDYWKSFRQNFKQGFIIELIAAAVFAILYVNIITCYRWSYEGSFFGQIMMFLNIGLGLICIASLIYLFPLLAQFTNTVRNTLFNSLLMAMKHLPQTLVLLLLTGGIVYAVICYPLFIFFFIGLMAYVHSYVLSRIFRQYMPKEEPLRDTYEVPEDVDDIWDRLAAGNAGTSESADDAGNSGEDKVSQSKQNSDMTEKQAEEVEQ